MTSQDTATAQQQPWPLRVGAELVGAFLICFAVYTVASFGNVIYTLNLAYAVLATGLVYAAVTYALGKVSGGQFNPAVTVAAMIVGRTKLVDGVLYIVAQVVGATLAGLLVRFLLPTSENVTLSQWLVATVNGFDKGSIAYSTLSQYGLSFSINQAIVVEVVASLVIVGAAMASYGTKRYAAVTGIAYAAGAAITFPVTGAALNPARATGIAVAVYAQGLDTEPVSQLWVFWICPVLAAGLVSLAMVLQQIIAAPKTKGDDPKTLHEYDEAADPAGEPTAVASESASDAEPQDGSDDQVDAEVGGEESDPKADADEGVERH
ncbi:MIP/aquaporin family protein [Bifidobacterium saguinibicoloris]|uniref:MIP/aquaporin family protein n=1 Tax=Bifidobacterium saguinibicoloris TaxID=2834433 RepID=UPI001C579EF4|nr:aquaporin [Bifidobacterium saguinibicoloris]MBW3079864.1 aquaporin [Bifidobacterium saguinibicoloris]